MHAPASALRSAVRAALLALATALLLAVAPAAAPAARADAIDLSRTPMLMAPPACAADATCAAHVRARDDRFAGEAPEALALREQRAMTFKTSPRVARAVDREVAALFPDRGPRLLRELMRALRRHDYRAALRDELDRRGWAGNDMGDLLALEFVIGWRIVNRERRTDVAADQAFRDGFRDLLMRQAGRSRGPAGGRAGDAEGQQLGESLVLMMLAMERFEIEARRRGLAPVARLLVREVRTMHRRLFRVDLAKLHQVPTGFAR